MTGPTHELDVRPLSRETFDVLGGLFAEGGDPRFCWCAFWRGRGSVGSRERVDQNRALLAGLAGQDDPAPGLVAFRDGRAVGWVSLGPRQAYPRLMHSQVLAPLDDRPVWSIVCFVVSRPERGQGIADTLLAAAVGYARQHGAGTLEAYPVDPGRGRVPAASAYTGTVSMFARAGFEVVATRRATPTSRPRPIMRRELAAAGTAGGQR